MNTPKSPHAYTGHNWQFKISNCSMKLKAAGRPPLGRICVRVFAAGNLILVTCLSPSVHGGPAVYNWTPTSDFKKA